MARIASAVLIVLVALSSACSSEDPIDPTALPSQGVEIEISGSGVEVVRSMSAKSVVTRSRAEEQLRFEYYTRGGDLLTAGIVDDPRVEVIELASRGEAEPEADTITHDGGRIAIRVPQVEGTLVVFEGAGVGEVRELGRVDYQPPREARSIGSTRQALDFCGTRECDDLEPVLFHGSGNTDNAIDILFVSAGYTEDELGDFHALRETMADDFLALPDFAEYLDRFNFWYIERPSETSGFGGDNPEYLYDASNNRWYADEGFTADMHEIGERVPAQVIVAIANEDGGRPNVATRGGRQIMSLYPDWESHGLLAHELGHAHFNLGDEYSERACNRATIESKAERWDNLTDDPGNSGWEHLTTLNYCPIWDFEQYPVIGYDYEQYRDEVSHFIGGGACDVVDSEATLWRGSLSCRMSKNWEHTMCPVCRDSIRKVFQEYSEDSSCPSSWDGDGICDRCLGDDSDCCRFSFNIRDLLGSGTEYLQCLVDSVCGNQVCEAVYGEDTETCPSDCYGAAFCGDGDCNYDETDENCPQDCGCAAADWGPDRCGAQVAAFGCGCDAECIDAGDCCADACSTCGECEELDERPSGPR